MVVAYGKTDLGCQRQSNEDVVVVDADLGFALVADGVGSEPGGEVAARLAGSSTHAVLKDGRDLLRVPSSDGFEEVEALVRRAIERADADIADARTTHPDWKGMATTVVMALAFRDRVLVAHVGDSRAYLLRQGKVHRLTEDHVQRTGPEVNADAPALARALGAQGAPSLSWFERCPDDLLLLCSDGLSDTLSSAAELSALPEFFAPSDIPEVLVDLARTRDAPDNIAIAVLAEEDDGPGLLPELGPLRQVPLLSDLSWLELAKILPTLPSEQLPANQVLQDRAGLAIVTRGRVQITRRGVSRIVPTGGLLGECSPTWGAPWPYGARTMEPTTLTFVPESTLGTILHDFPSAARLLWHLLQDSTEKLLAWTSPESGLEP
ncbi:MAG: protein phosphatase 2C domain-containing protein [Myxococcota bacterium]